MRTASQRETISLRLVRNKMERDIDQSCHTVILSKLTKSTKYTNALLSVSVWSQPVIPKVNNKQPSLH